MSCPAVIHVYASLGQPKAVVVVTPGPQGPIGSRWLGGATAPAASLGVIGDWYLRANGDVYGPKGASGWGSVVFALQPPLSSAPVQSVAGRTGAVVLAVADVSGAASVGLAAGLALALG